MKHITLLLLISSLFFSCGSDDKSRDNGSNPTESYYILVKAERFSPEGVSRSIDDIINRSGFGIVSFDHIKKHCSQACLTI